MSCLKVLVFLVLALFASGCSQVMEQLLQGSVEQENPVVPDEDEDDEDSPEALFCDSAEIGDVDLSFATDGFYQWDYLGVENANPWSSGRLTIDDEGRVYLVGWADNGSYRDIAIHRVDADGVVDAAFGSAGTKVIDLGSDSRGAAIQFHDDSLYVSVNGSGGDRLIKTDLAGDLDLSFGSSGVSVNSNNTTGDGLYISDFGEIFQTGHTGSPHYLSATRFDSDGVVESSFASSGYLTSSTGTNQFGHALVFNDDQDQFFMVSEVWNSNFDFKVTKYNWNGSIDTSFGSSGIFTTDLGGSERARHVDVDSNGSVYVLGQDSTDSIVIKLDPNGVVDASFGSSGVERYSLGDSSEVKEYLVRDDDTWVFFNVSSSGSDYLAIAKVNIDGSLDSSFGVGGVASYDWPGGQDAQMINIEWDDHGRALLSFEVENGSDADVGAMRICF